MGEGEEALISSMFNLFVFLIFENISYLLIADDPYRAQSSSVSPRGGGYCSSTSTPSTGGSGSYATTSITNGYGPPPTSANVFNSTSSKLFLEIDVTLVSWFYFSFFCSLLQIKGHINRIGSVLIHIEKFEDAIPSQIKQGKFLLAN